MSKSRREHNYKKEEARYSDGSRKIQQSHIEELQEKKMRNMFRSNNVSQFLQR